jgi:hypothetical protein
VFWEFAKKKLATRKDKIKIIKSLPLALSVSREERCEVLAFICSEDVSIFFLRASVHCWITGSIKNCQRMFVEEFGGKQAPRISPHD